MPARMPRGPSGVESENPLRKHTARLLHDATWQHAKMVAAEIDNWSLERVYNQTGARCANPLEILTRWLDRLVRETGETSTIAPVLAFLNQRYRNDDTPGDGIEDELAALTHGGAPTH